MDKLTILIVDDIEMNREMIQMIFENDYTVLQAADGIEAMKIIESTPIEILITNIFMKPMDGYELIQTIRAKEEYKKIPIIAITESDLASRHKALGVGADDLVYKPFIGDILQKRVKDLVFYAYDPKRYKLAHITDLKKIILDYLCSLPEIDLAMNKILAMVGEFLGVDRTYIFENSKDGLTCSNTFEWCNQGIQPEINNLQNIRYLEDLGGEYEDNFDENGIFICPSIDVLPEKQRLILKPQKIKSMLQCAVLVHGEFKGYIGFDNCSDKETEWENNTEATETLVYISHLLSLYLMDYRNKREDELAKEKKALEKEHEQNLVMANLLNELPGGVAVFKVTDHLECSYFSDGFATMTGRSREEVSRMLEDESLLKQGIPLDCYYDFLGHLKEENPVGKPLSFTYHIIMITGEIGWLHVSATKIREEDGFPVYYCIYTNPTDETALYRSIVEESAIGVYIADRATRTNLYINEAFCRLSGFDFDKVNGMKLDDILQMYDKEELVTKEEIASLSTEHYSEFHSIRKGGLYLTIKAKAMIWNHVDSYILYVTDETNEHRNHLNLEQTLIKEQTLMEAISGGTAIYRLKKDGTAKVEYASDGLLNLFGYSRSEIMALSDASELVYSEDRVRAVNLVLQAIQNNTQIHVIYRVVAKSGEVILIRLDAKVMNEDNLQEDELTVVYAVHTRLSDQTKLAMQEQKYYRMILNMTGTAYFEWDKMNGFYASEDYSKYALSIGGYNAVMGGAGGPESIHPEDFAALRYFTRQTSLPGCPKSITVRMKMKDGHYQWTEVRSYAERDASGNFTKLVGVLRDVDKEYTEQNKKLQEALEVAQQANRAKTAFLSRVSHDMRTPLNGILGLTSFLKDTVTDIQSRNDIDQLEISGQYLLNLINDTLDVSRIENGKLELHPVVCDGKEVFENIVKLAKPSAEAKHQKFQVITNGVHYAELYCDVGRIEQIIMNIVGNAVKFTADGGAIDCKLEQLEETATTITHRITIRDNGIGMSKEFIPVIFDAFSQADDTKTNTRQGTGLGMAITKQLVDLMGGTIHVESELGKGSCFTIIIPFSKATKKQVAAWKASLTKEVDDSILSGKHILVCEDHPLNREIAIRLLKNKGMIVECAENGQLGVDSFEKSEPHHFDLVLMDVRMPVMDGLDATRAIRKLSREDAHIVPIIAMTGNSFDEDVAKTLDAGMNAHLSKPIDSVKLFDTLRDQLSNPHFYHRGKVLVADDVEVNRAVIRASLESDFDVIEVSDGIEALDCLSKDTGIVAVITDLMMPNMDGFELVKNIRADYLYDTIVVVANTQYGEMTQEENLRRMGVNGFIYKPNFPESVVKKLHEVLKNQNQ